MSIKKKCHNYVTFVFSSTSDGDFDPEQFAGENVPVLVVATKQVFILYLYCGNVCAFVCMLHVRELVVQ